MCSTKGFECSPTLNNYMVIDTQLQLKKRTMKANKEYYLRSISLVLIVKVNNLTAVSSENAYRVGETTTHIYFYSGPRKL